MIRRLLSTAARSLGNNAGRNQRPVRRRRTEAVASNGFGQRIALVTGTPRSGTTLLAGLINMSPKAACCNERYSDRIRGGGFETEWFTPDRLGRFDPEDGSIESFRHRITQRAIAKAHSADVICDKVPRVADVIGIAQRHGVAVLVILRAPFGVVESFQQRADAPDDDWPPERDYRIGVREFNRAVDLVKTEIVNRDRSYPLLVVPYHDLVSGDFDVERIFEFLGVETPDRSSVDDVLQMKPEDVKRRLHRENYVAMNANFNGYRAIFAATAETREDASI